MSFSCLARRKSADKTGTSVKVSTSEPTMAKVMVSAMGLKSFPSKPVSEKSGRNTTMMMRMAKAIGFMTSFAAANITWVRLTARSP